MDFEVMETELKEDLGLETEQAGAGLRASLHTGIGAGLRASLHTGIGAGLGEGEGASLGAGLRASFHTGIRAALWKEKEDVLGQVSEQVSE